MSVPVQNSSSKHAVGSSTGPTTDTQRAFSSGTRKTLGLLLVASLALNLPVGSGLLLGHLSILLCIIGFFFGSVMHRRNPTGVGGLAAARLLYVALFATILSLWTFGTPDRFGSEAPKVLLLILGSLAISRIFEEDVWNLLPWAAYGLAINVLYEWWRTPEAFSYGGRLQLDDLGSPNSLSFLMALVVLVLVFSVHHPFAPWHHLTRWPLVGVMLFLMIQTTSRGGFVSLASGIVAGVFLASSAGRLGKKVTAVAGVTLLGVAVLYTAAAAGYLASFTNRLDLTQQGSSTGRTEIWRILLDTQISDSRGLIYGFGPGSIDVSLFGKQIESAHSMVLTMLFYFGVIGLAAFAYFLVRAWGSALKALDQAAPLRLALLGAFSIGFVVDNAALATQALLPATIMLAACITAGSSPVLPPAGRLAVRRSLTRRKTLVHRR